MRENDKYHMRQTVKASYQLWESQSAPMAGSEKERER